MKKIVFVLSLVLILILSSVTAFADEIVITIDSAKVEFNDDAGFPFIDENNRTQVPFRATLEKFGAKVEWNDESKTAIATKGETVKYFGKYVQDGKTLLRLQYILSGDIYKEMFADFSEVMPEPASEEEAMAYEMIQNIGNIDIGDLSYIIYVDEATGEMVKMEIDLGDAVSSMASGMIEAMGMPPETVEVLKSLKADMSVEFLNINSAKDFEIPKEALEAQDIYEMMQEMQDTQIEFELEEDL